MTFSDILNSNALFVASLLLALLVVGLRAGFVNQGWNRHLVYLWTLFIYLQYCFISPFFFYVKDRRYIIGTDILDYYGLGFFFSAIGVLSFIVGYWIKGRVNNRVYFAQAEKQIQQPTKYIAYLFYALYGVVLLNMAYGGIDLANVFLGTEQLGLGARGESYFFQNFGDSLISVIVLGYLFGVKPRTLILWIAASFFLFSLLGFRYRIMLTLFGLAFAYLYKNKIRAKQMIIGVAGALLFFYIILFLTENRFKLIQRDYATMSYNPAEFDFGNYFEQTRGSLADMAVYKLYDNPNKTVDHDYGVSLFGYIFIRMIPRSVYEDKDKFYPPPQIKIVHKAYDAWWGKSSGEATLNLSAFYIAFGWFGIVAGFFFSGLLVRRLADRVRLSEKTSIALNIIVALAMFQWITRGYFPQSVDHFIYLVIPIFLLRLKAARVKSEKKAFSKQTALSS